MMIKRRFGSAPLTRLWNLVLRVFWLEGTRLEIQVYKIQESELILDGGSTNPPTPHQAFGRPAGSKVGWTPQPERPRPAQTHKHTPSNRDPEAAGPGRGAPPSPPRGPRGTLPSRLSASTSTFGVGGCPGNEAPHQAAVQQDLGGEAVTPAQVLQPLPPLAPLGAHAGATNTGWVSDR